MFCNKMSKQPTTWCNYLSLDCDTESIIKSNDKVLSVSTCRN